MTDASVVHTVEVENQIDTLLLEVRRAESAARGYLLTSAPDFLRDHETAVAAIIPDVEKLVGADGGQSGLRSKTSVDCELRWTPGSSSSRKEIDFVKQNQREAAVALLHEAAAARHRATYT